jgi:hypothetical protein
MNTDKNKLKAFQVRMPHDIWHFLRKVSADQCVPMNDIVNSLILKYKNKFKKSLTDKNDLI